MSQTSEQPPSWSFAGANPWISTQESNYSFGEPNRIADVDCETREQRSVVAAGIIGVGGVAYLLWAASQSVSTLLVAALK